MKIISVEAARTIWLFPISELNPGGRALTPVFGEIAKRYAFQKTPKHTYDFDSDNALTFDQGEFENRDGSRVLVKCRVFNDGIVADCWSSTRDSADFLQDLMALVRTNHGLELPADRMIRILYLSELTVTTDKLLMNLNPKLTEFAKLLSSMAQKFRGDALGFNVGSIGFWTNDPTRPNAVGPFRFENKIGTIPSEKRYFTQAPFPTDAHVELLNALEAIL